MKKFSLSVLYFAASMISVAQTINIHKTGGAVVSYSLADVEYIDFTIPEDREDLSPEGTEAVDLGLPSGIKWANMNIGATKPSDSGLYFAWGETTGYGTNIFDGRVFDWTSYAWSGSAQSTITKYCTSASFGTVDNLKTLTADDDAAHVNWGGQWRMPTSAEFTELMNNTTWTWTTVDGVSGWTFTSKTNSNSIFLPAAGYRSSNYADFVSNRGRYWSSTLLESNQNNACNLGFGETYVTVYNDLRINALTIRAVQK